MIKKLRGQGIKTPVMIVMGAKVRALSRRNKHMLPDRFELLECGPFTYNTSTMRFYKKGEEIPPLLEGEQPYTPVYEAS